MNIPNTHEQVFLHYKTACIAQMQLVLVALAIQEARAGDTEALDSVNPDALYEVADTITRSIDAQLDHSDH